MYNPLYISVKYVKCIFNNTSILYLFLATYTLLLFNLFQYNIISATIRQYTFYSPGIKIKT